MTRKPAFWIALLLLGLTGAFLASRLFPEAFPLLAVDVEMDRSEAMEEADTLAQRFDWGPSNARQAASFGQLDLTFQTYMELEGGGLGELNRLIREGEVILYAWKVRRFAQGAVEETEVQFTPAGTAYGFNLRLPEEAPGTNVSPAEARDLAVAGAVADWGMDPSIYRLLESSQEERPGGRIDHTFVYQRTDLSLGEATLRLRLRVAGDQLAEVTRFAHVPDAFQRRYQDTRNANDSVALAGQIAFVLLFLLLGGGIGTAYLLRNRLVAWKIPLAIGAVTSALMAMDALNSLPLAWMGYDTALSARVFLALNVLSALGIFLAGTAFLAFILLAGEGLLRAGFPGQLQQWKIWSPGVANSDPALGRTLAPYLVLGLELGYVVVFYTLMSRWAGWWSPASALVEPDLLATPLPWLTAVSNSLFAAFSEESLFRAIPIGAAALLGRRYGKAPLWIWGAIVLQAVVFAASHANYPQQPSYARLVEIFPLYVGWGAVCLFFGLVPTIIGHFLYDLTLFSLPLFAAETSTIWVSRLVVIAVGFSPLAVVLVTRWRRGRAVPTPEWALNRSWAPRERKEKRAPTPPAPSGARIPLPAWERIGILGLALAGLITWAGNLKTDTGPRFTVTRPEAIGAARAALFDRGVELSSDWTPLVAMNATQGASYEFAWRSGTEEEYQEMLGRFLPLPAMEVRFVRLDVPPEERAETWTVSVDPSGGVVSIDHTLPEARPGDTLSEDQARELALQALERRLEINPRTVREISAEETARPNRSDWTFTFADTTTYPLQEGEGRLQVRIAGEEVVGASRFVHVPEGWDREWRSRQTRALVERLPPMGVVLVLLVAAAVYAIVRWARGSLWTGPLKVLTPAVAVLTLLTVINDWPGRMGQFTTLQSFGNQTAILATGISMGLLVMAGGVGLLGALAHTWIRNEGPSAGWAFLMGLAAGAAVRSGSAILHGLLASAPPAWPGYGGLVSYWPWATGALQPVAAVLFTTAAALLLLAGMERLRRTGHRWTAALLLLLVGLALAPHGVDTGWIWWIAGGLGAAVALWLLWLLTRRLGWPVVTGIVGAGALMHQTEVVLERAYSGSAAGGLVGAVLIAVVLLLWTRALRRPSAEPHRASG